MRLAAIRVNSSLPLQRALFVNSWYSLGFGTAHVGLVIYKMAYTEPSAVTMYALPVCLAIWMLAEGVRLRLGYAGNLLERISELSAFWLLTLFPTLIVVLCLSFAQVALGDATAVADIALGVPMTTLLLTELVISLSAARVLIRKQTAEFYQRVAAAEAVAMRTNAHGEDSDSAPGHENNDMGANTIEMANSHSGNPHAIGTGSAAGSMDDSSHDVALHSIVNTMDVARIGARHLWRGGLGPSS